MAGLPNNDVPNWPEFLALLEAWRDQAGAGADAAGLLRWVVLQMERGEHEPLLQDILLRFHEFEVTREPAHSQEDAFLLWLARCCAEFARLAGSDDRLLLPRDRPAEADDEPVFADLDDTAPLPERIGPFVIDAVIGRGGMGVIYRGEREDESRQVAAVKVLQRLGAPYVNAFKKEMRLLASLQHANIAFFLDHGTTPEGRPWLALEYIDGRPLDVWCAEEKPSLNERLAVFLKICDAVGYAHNNLIIHRDLKPNNILIQRNGEPKLLDFGIASILDPDTERQQTMTLYQQWACTPDYASPEQLRRERLTVASDVYSLGVLLYQLLTGSKPYEVDTLSPLELLKTTTDPTINKPSRHVLKRTSPSAVASGRLRGDLDVICMKALAPDTAQRYAGVSLLADDLRRFQDGLPIEARPASTFYQFTKFVQRNRVQVLWSALLVLVLIGATVQAYRQSAQISRERDRAALQRDQAEEVRDFLVSMFQQVDPVTAGKAGEEVSALDLLEGGRREMQERLHTNPETRATLLLTLGGVYRGLGQYQLSHELLVEAARLTHLTAVQRLEVELGLVQTMLAEGLYTAAHERFETTQVLKETGWSDARRARIEHLRGKVFFGLGQYQHAKNAYAAATEILGDSASQTALDLKRDQAALLRELDLYESALLVLEELFALEQTRFGAGHPRLLPTLASMGKTLVALARYDEAATFLNQAEQLVLQHYGREHPFYVDHLLRLAKLAEVQSDYTEPEPYLLEALTLGKRILGHDHPVVTAVMKSLSSVYMAQGRLEDGEALLRQGYADLVKRHGDTFPGLRDILIIWADIMKFRGEYALAEERLRQALGLPDQGDGGGSILGKAHLLERLARLQQERGLYAEAETHFREVLTLRRGRLGLDHPKVAHSLNDLGFLLSEKGGLDEAARYFQEALRINRQVFGDQHPEVARTLNHIGMVHWDRDEWDLAETYTRQALALYEQRYNELNLAVANTLDQLCSILKEQEEYVEAEEAGRRAVAIKTRLFGPSHPYLATSLNNLAAVLSKNQDFDGAAENYRRAIDIMVEKLGRESLDYSIMLNNLAVVHYRNRNFLEAEQVYLEVLRVQDHIFPEGNLNTASSSRNLGYVYQALGRAVSAEPYFRRSLLLREKQLGPMSYGTSSSLNGLAETLLFLADFEAAERAYCRSLDIRLAARGPDHVSVGLCRFGLARVAAARWRPDEAETQMRAALSIFERGSGRNPSRIAGLYELLLQIQQQRGDEAGVAAVLKQGLALEGLTDRDRLSLKLAAAWAAPTQQDDPGLVRLLDEADATYFDAQDPTHLARVNHIRARLLMRREAWSQAEALLRQALKARESAYGEAHPLWVATQIDLATVLFAAGRHDQALARVRQVQQAVALRLPADHPYHAVLQALNGNILQARGDDARGKQLVGKAHATLVRRLGAEHPLIRRAALSEVTVR